MAKLYTSRIKTLRLAWPSLEVMVAAAVVLVMKVCGDGYEDEW